METAPGRPRYPVPLEVLSERQNHRCCWCGTRLSGHIPDPDAPTYEHVTPRSKGGADDDANLVAACFDCNQLRRSMHWSGFLAWISACRAIDEAGHDIEIAWADLIDDWFRASHRLRQRISLERYFGSLCTRRALEGLPSPNWHLFLAYTKAFLNLASAGTWRDPLTPTSGQRLHARMKPLSEQQNHRCCFCGARLDGRGDPNPVYLLPRALRPLEPTPRLPAAVCCRSCASTRRDYDGYTLHEKRHLIVHGTETPDPGPCHAARAWLWDYLTGPEQQRVLDAYLADNADRPEDSHSPRFFGWLDQVYRNWNALRSGAPHPDENADENAEDRAEPAMAESRRA